jgi:hypothetical protein
MACATTEFAITVELHLRDGLRERVEGQIARVNTGFLLLRSPIALQPARSLNVSFFERLIPCEVVYCLPQATDNYRIGARLLDGSAGSLRAERRIRLDAPAKLHTTGLTEPLPVRVIDMSTSGVGVRLRAPVTVGHLAYIELDHGFAFGEVRHCEKVEQGYRAGIFLEEFIARTDGGTDTWTASGLELPDGSGVSKLVSVIRTALFAKRKS